MENQKVSFTESEGKLMELLPEHIKFISRDEGGDLWATEGLPEIIDVESGKMLVFAQPVTQENTHSLAVFNHAFKPLAPLSIMALMRESQQPSEA